MKKNITQANLFLHTLMFSKCHNMLPLFKYFPGSNDHKTHFHQHDSNYYLPFKGGNDQQVFFKNNGTEVQRS